MDFSTMPFGTIIHTKKLSKGHSVGPGPKFGAVSQLIVIGHKAIRGFCLLLTHVNPNPHCFKTRGLGIKRASILLPPAQHCGGRGRGDDFSACSLAELLNKNVNCTHHCSLKIKIFLESFETNQIVEIIYESFFNLKK
jgi:hypothetical protein